MKRLVKQISLLLIIMLPLLMHAQDKKFKFGLKGTGNLSWSKSSNKQMENDKAGLGYSYGLMGDFRLGGGNYFLSFGLEVLTANNDLEFTSDVVSQTVVGTSNNDSTIYFPGGSIYSSQFGYVTLPFSLKMTTNEIGYMTYYAQFGVDLGIKYKAISDINYYWNKTAEPPILQEVDISDQTSLFRMGLLIGGGFEFNVSGSTNLMVGLTYSNGFTNTFSKKYKNDAGEKVENRTVTFDENGNLKYDSSGNLVTDGEFKSSTLRYVALNVGIYF